MNITRFILNTTSVSLPTQWQIIKAKREYLKNHPKCAVCCNEKRVEVHHIIPVHVDRTKACDPNNFISLCDEYNKGCHYNFGHYRNFRSKWNVNIRQFAEYVRNFNASNTNQKS